MEQSTSYCNPEAAKAIKNLKSWVDVSADSHFPIQNLPYGIFSTEGDNTHRIGVAIGDQVLDLVKCVQFKLFPTSVSDILLATTLNPFMAAGRGTWTVVRKRIQELLSSNCQDIQGQDNIRNTVLVDRKNAIMHLPAMIGDEHATNLGIMFRGPENALMPNWLHLPVGYHGRASSVVVSGSKFPRPCGQKKPPTAPAPVWAPCGFLDYELELGVFVGPGNDIGKPIPVSQARNHLFGVVLLNDWSARDIQKWEYVPLGPFNGKNFQTTISPWVVTMDALEPYRSPNPKREKPILPYLQQKDGSAYDIDLTVAIQSQTMKKPAVIGKTNFQSMYWSFSQQLAHHSSTGCNMRPGDLLGTGTISGTTEESYGSLIEKTKVGKNPLKLNEEENRTFLQDYDTVVLSGCCFNDSVGFRIGFGDCVGQVLPAIDPHPHATS